MAYKGLIQIVTILGVMYAASAACPAKCACTPLTTTTNYDKFHCTGLTDAELTAAITNLKTHPTMMTLHLTNFAGSTLKPEQFKGAEQLTSLALLGSAALTKVDVMAFKGMSKLTYVRISEAKKLTSLPDAVFEPLKTKVTQIELVGNGLTTIKPEMTKNLTSLVMLNLDGNAIGNLDVKLFSSIPWASISAKKNPYDCSCKKSRELGYYVLNLLTLRKKVTVTITCKMPVAFGNKTLGTPAWRKELCPCNIKEQEGFPDWAMVIVVSLVGTIILVIIGIFCQRAKRRDFEKLKAREAQIQAGDGYDNAGYN